MDNLTFSKYMYETFSGGSANQLQISSVCNAKCIFCSNNMNPFRIHRLGFRSLEDIKRGISLLNPQAQEIRLGDSLPGRISEGEALLHPDIIKILGLIRQKIPKSIIQMNTNGTMLSKKFIEKLIPYKPLKFTISYHSDNPENWCRIFNLKQDKYKIARDAFVHLLKEGFLVEGVMVPLPNLVGYSDIENTIKNFKPFTKNVIVYAPGYSFKASKALKTILATDFSVLSRFFTKMRKKYRMNLILLPELLGPLDFYPYPIMCETCNLKFLNVLWLFSEAAYGRAKIILRKFNKFVPNEHYASMVKNYTYRGNIICSGLLMVNDYRKAIKKAFREFKKIKIDLLILSRSAFDRFGDDLMGENYSKLTEEFGVPVWLR
jgi:uncharacterized Fe-S cluster-containing radical SAM superfamily protein